MAEAGYISANAVMAYAPRNSAEIGIMLVSGMIIGPAFTLFVVPSIYMLIARVHAPVSLAEVSDFPEEVEPAA
jgi:multidrug efflux pump